MPILTVSRWRIKQDQGSRVVREAAPLLKAQGATRVTVGHIRTGSDAGETTIAVQYENWETFGRAMQAMHDDQAYHHIFQQAVEHHGAKLQSRNIVATEEIT
jgi:hypothetical protein